MKTMKRSSFKTIILTVAILFAAAYASGQDIHKTFSWKYNISNDARVKMVNYDCNLAVYTWEKGEAEFRLSVEAEARSSEDAAALEKYLNDLVFSTSPSSVAFSSVFWESRNTIVNRTTMKLPGGKSIILKSFAMKGELWIPDRCNFTLDSKYSRIDMEDFDGPLTLSLYNNNFYGGKITSSAEIRDKYSTIEFKDTKDLRVSLYNSKINAGNTDDLTIDSKYSSITLASCKKLTSDSYNDKYDIPRTDDVQFTAKYSDLNTDLSGNATINLYNGNINMKQVKDLKINSKYGEYHFSVTGSCRIISSYNDKLTFGRLGSLDIDGSKYASFRIGHLEGSVKDRDCYNDNFMISDTGKEFGGMNLNGKYITASLSMPGTTDYHFKADVRYADFKMDESALRPVEKIVEGSNVKYDAFRGHESDDMPVIEVRGYQVTLKIADK